MSKMIDVGERIKYIRETYDLTQKDLANILNVKNRSSIAVYEKERIIPIEHLVTLADYLDLSLDYVLGLTKEKNYSDSKKGMFISTMAKHINEICLEQHFTNLTLAEKLNTCESNIRNYRNGKYFILTALALDLALKFNYSVDWIIGKTNKKTLD